MTVLFVILELIVFVAGIYVGCRWSESEKRILEGIDEGESKQAFLVSGSQVHRNSHSSSGVLRDRIGCEDGEASENDNG